MYLDSVSAQVKVTHRILKGIDRIDSSQQSDFCLAARMIKVKAMELDSAVQHLIKASEEADMRVFLDESFRGNSRAQHFDRLQRELSQAQAILITVLVAHKVNDMDVFRIRTRAMNLVNQSFSRHYGFSCAPPIFQLLKAKGGSVGNGSEARQIGAEDFETFSREQQSSEPKTIRMMERGEVTELNLMTTKADAPGRATATADEIRAIGSMLAGNATVIAGHITFETGIQTQILRQVLNDSRARGELAHEFVSRVMQPPGGQ
ncbi:hypothetical protein SAMD00023353_0200760 [Rosellinia necatrix]|uniref:Uncharacterized protein n=1 Tax=Rosellinia necatrix TaxID=77044 RepID=A0A1S7UJX8_ROSNE|nr:hypothetical protein SAMD00023353_0200760 [Rosellinia necatrix]